MNLYLAPMEGITGYIFRNTIFEYFGQGIDKYYTPFLIPCEKRGLSHKEINEISFENNQGINLVPQVLTTDVNAFNTIKIMLRDMGYSEVNINLGCPSRTVASKNRGSGALRDIDYLNQFLDGIFSDGDTNISIKTRIGISDPDEFHNILNVYKQYPICELTIHPRVMNEQYRGHAHKDVFYDTLSLYNNPLCYNGDICSQEDLNNLISNNPTDKSIDSVMIGRGMLKNPSLIRELSGGRHFTNEEISEYLNTLRIKYEEYMSGEVPVLYKMKEIWSHLGTNYSNKDKTLKKLFKCKKLSEYKIYQNEILFNND